MILTPHGRHPRMTRMASERTTASGDTSKPHGHAYTTPSFLQPGTSGPQKNPRVAVSWLVDAPTLPEISDPEPDPRAQELSTPLPPSRRTTPCSTHHLTLDLALESEREHDSAPQPQPKIWLSSVPSFPREQSSRNRLFSNERVLERAHQARQTAHWSDSNRSPTARHGSVLLFGELA
ncbi:hypothetical protein BKA81DRAFT_69447 [Phyllosticta paracitricarpa]